MIGSRLSRLSVIVLPVLTLCSVCITGPGTAFAQAPQAAPNSQPPQQQKPAPQKKEQNPFENVPESPQTPPPSQPQQVPPGVQEPPKVGAGAIEAIEFRGQRRIPQDTLRALIMSRKGDAYSEESIHRDFMALWNTGRFDDLSVEKEAAPDGGIIV